jgi:hypothetical protein
MPGEHQRKGRDKGENGSVMLIKIRREWRQEEKKEGKKTCGQFGLEGPREKLRKAGLMVNPL